MERRAGSRIAVTRSRSVSAWLIATHNADGSFGVTSHPVSPLLIISGMPPTRAPITGVPEARASITTTPCGSERDGTT